MSRGTISPSLELERILRYLRYYFHSYPYDFEKDISYFEMLIAEFSDLNVEDELRDYNAWILDQTKDKVILHRFYFRLWLKTSRLIEGGPRDVGLNLC